MDRMFLKEPRMGVAAALLLLLPIVGCGGDEVEPEPTPVPTTVEITPDAVELLSSGATTGLNAVVRDQNGKAMPNASVTWTGSDAAVFTVAGDGLIATVTAVANGMGTVTATAGQASGTASVTVVQTPATLDLISGDEQEALRGTALAEPLVVRVTEQTGASSRGLRSPSPRLMSAAGRQVRARRSPTRMGWRRRCGRWETRAVRKWSPRLVS